MPLLLPLFLAVASPGEPRACIAAPVVDAGAVVGEVCVDEAAAAGLTLLDLSDGWAPRVLVETAYRATFVGLASGLAHVPGAVPGAGPRARDDLYFEPWGIHPTLTVLRARLDDDDRHECHAAAKTNDQHLACDGTTSLGAWQRREGLTAVAAPGGVLDDDTSARLVLDSRERDLLALLRALRERVVDAAGLLEDGTAAGVQAPVVGWLLDPPSMRPALPALGPRGGREAGDVVGQATDAAARALGFVDVEGARRALDTLPWQGRVAVRLPPPPAWHAPHMALRATIARGDVTASGIRRAGGDAPAFTLVTAAVAGDVPLVRWPTTTGGQQREKTGAGVVVKNKASPTGTFAWRYLWAAPAWYAPPSTPDDELLLRTPAGVVVNDEGIGPGYRSAFGLVMLQHHEQSGERWSDTGVRTHGTGNVRSVLEGGASHGCHRLLPVLALRLGGFLLAHREHAPAERVLESWQRDLRAGERILHVERRERGTRTELVPPVPVEVLEGCVGGEG